MIGMRPSIDHLAQARSIAMVVLDGCRNPHADGGVDMTGKQTNESRTVSEHRQLAVIPKPAPRAQRTESVRRSYVLPARFLEGTAWDEV